MQQLFKEIKHQEHKKLYGLNILFTVHYTSEFVKFGSSIEPFATSLFVFSHFIDKIFDGLTKMALSGDGILDHLEMTDEGQYLKSAKGPKGKMRGWRSGGIPSCFGKDLDSGSDY